MPESGDQSYRSRYNRLSAQNRATRNGTALREVHLAGNGLVRSGTSKTAMRESSRSGEGRQPLWSHLFGQKSERTSNRNTGGRTGFGDRANRGNTQRRSLFDDRLTDTNPRQLALLPATGKGGQGSTGLGGNRRHSSDSSSGLSSGLNRRQTTAMSAMTPRNPTSRPRRRENLPQKPQSRSVSAALYAARILILSIGLGVLAGTVLSVWDPASKPLASGGKKAPGAVNQGAAIASTEQASRLGQELTQLKPAMQAVMQKNPQMSPGLFLVDLDRNSYLDMNGGATFSAASTIKVPILIAFLQDVDAGKIRLDEQLVLRKELIGGGSGDMQYQPPGTKYSALETATKMITISDNTATNLIIARLGGLNNLNRRFQSWGLVVTRLNNLLPDLEGTNTTTPKELASLVARVSQGELLSLRSRDRMLDIMRRTENNSQLPQGLGPGSIIAHKTGDIGSVIGDVGLIDLPNGKRYAAMVLVKRPFNDDRAYDVVSQISRVAYQFFSRAAGNQTTVLPTGGTNTMGQPTSSSDDPSSTDISALLSDVNSP